MCHIKPVIVLPASMSVYTPVLYELFLTPVIYGTTFTDVLVYFLPNRILHSGLVHQLRSCELSNVIVLPRFMLMGRYRFARFE